MKNKKNEQNLVKKLQFGDSLAVKNWFDEYYPQLLKLSTNQVSNQKDAEDLVQETMINCLKKIHLFRAEASLKTWMMTILRHEIADYYRKKYAKKAIKTLPLGNYLLKEPIQDVVVVEELVETRVKKVLEKMLQRRRKILLLKYVDGLGVKQIAKRLGKTFKAVEADLYRARNNFKDIYLEEIEKSI